MRHGILLGKGTHRQDPRRHGAPLSRLLGLRSISGACCLALLICLGSPVGSRVDAQFGQPPVTDQGQPRAVTPGLAPGGGAMADFTSLMNLIEQTIAPDTWENLGGSSTMSPYPQGVMVNPNGTTGEVSKASAANADGFKAFRRRLLVPPPGGISNRDWSAPAALRCVSLKRLHEATAASRKANEPIGIEIRNLAGLSVIKYILFTEDDVIIAGSVGGIELRGDWLADAVTGRVPIRNDFLARCLASSMENRPFGCTIDPTPQGLQRAMGVGQSIQTKQTPITKAADAMEKALGMQRVEVFGTRDDSAIAMLMVVADRHMKQLALEEAEMPEGVETYFDAVTHFIAQGPPSDVLMRLWFKSKPMAVRCDSEEKIFEIAGLPIELSGENQRALANGQRGNVMRDPRSERFVENFNRNFSTICDRYPVYSSLESLYRAAAVANIINRFGDDRIHQLAEAFIAEDAHTDWKLRAPKQVESIAAMHTVRHRTKRHHILVASGGVWVSPGESVKQEPIIYASLEQENRLIDLQPEDTERWWWDAAK